MSDTATRERIDRIRSVMQEAYELLGFKNVTDREYGIVCALAQAIKDLDELTPALTALCEEMERDTERLNWLEANPGKIKHSTWYNHNLGRLWDFKQDGSGTLGEFRQTLRQAIDKAMLPQPPAN